MNDVIYIGNDGTLSRYPPALRRNPQIDNAVRRAIRESQWAIYKARMELARQAIFEKARQAQAATDSQASQ